MRVIKLVLTICVTGLLAAASAADLTEDVTTSDARDRTYFIHTPPGYDGQTPLPLLIVLHYGGSNQGQNMALATGLSVKADEEGFIAVYPNALAPGWSNHDALFLDELVDTLKERYAVDERKVFMTGWSAGACMSHWMACKLSDEVAAFAPVAGSMMTYDWTGCYPSRPPSIVSINSRNDPMVPYAGDGGTYAPVEEAMGNWAERLECDQGPDSTYNAAGVLSQTWSRSDGKCDLVLWTTEAADHGWPTEESAHKLSSNDVMWDFFTAHPIPEDEPAVIEYPAPTSDLELHTPEIITDKSHASFSLNTPQHVCICLFDAAGRKIRTLSSREGHAGINTVNIDPSGLDAGVYYLRVLTPTISETARIIVLN